MTEAEFLPIVSDCLIHAAQLSYVENAPGTHGVLKKLITVMKYMQRSAGEIRFGEEWAMLAEFLELQRIRMPDRFRYEITPPDTMPGNFVSKGRYLGDLMELVHRESDALSGPLGVSLRVASPASVEVEVFTPGGSRTMSMGISA